MDQSDLVKERAYVAQVIVYLVRKTSQELGNLETGIRKIHEIKNMEESCLRAW